MRSKQKETARVIDTMFKEIEAMGLRAIALSNEENVRGELLSLMQSVSNYKLRLHEAIQADTIDAVLIREEDITDELMARLPAEAEIIDLNKKEETDDNAG